MDDLTDSMEAQAKRCAESLHTASNVEALQFAAEAITYKSDARVEFFRRYVVHMVGGIIGANRFEVGVQVRSRISKTGAGWSGRVIDSFVVYDLRK